MLNSSEHYPSKLSKGHGEKDKSKWKSERNYSQLVKTTHQKFETVERKKKKELVGEIVSKKYIQKEGQQFPF